MTPWTAPVRIATPWGVDLPPDYRTHQSTLCNALFVSAIAPPGDPFSPFGVSFALETPDGTRYVAILKDRDAVIRLVETVLNKAKEVWPEIEDQGDNRR